MSIQRRTRLDESTLVVGVDLAKGVHVAVLERAEGTFSKPRKFRNDRVGFESLRAVVDEHQRRHGTGRVVVGFESTGHYGKPFEEWLAESGYEPYIVSTLHTKRAKDMLDNSPLKTDAKDAAVIADLVRQGYGKPVVTHEEVYVELRALVELRGRLVREKTACLNRLHRVLDTLFPELPGLFKSLEGKAILALLAVAPTPASILAMGLEALEKLLRTNSRGRLGRDRAKAIVGVAETSVGCRIASEARRIELDFLLPRIAELAKQVLQVEAEMTKRLLQVPYAGLLLQVPYLGTPTVAALLGELGDMRRYRSARQVTKMAGLTLYEKSSGKQVGARHINKRGRSRLRTLLYLAASRMLAKGRPLQALHERSNGKPFPKVAVAGMRRLIRMLHAIVRDGAPYESQKFIAGPHLGTSDELAA